MIALIILLIIAIIAIASVLIKKESPAQSGGGQPIEDHKTDGDSMSFEKQN